MSTYQTEAIVLFAREFGEADVIVHLLTPERGRIAAIGKHARKSTKRFPGSLDLFNHLDVELRPNRRGGMPLLLRARLVSPFLSLREEPGRYGSYGWEKEMAKASGSRIAIFGELWAFMKVRKKWWLGPIIFTMILLSALIVLTEGSAVAPFIYALF